jgi:hypothetical protein
MTGELTGPLLWGHELWLVSASYLVSSRSIIGELMDILLVSSWLYYWWAHALRLAMSGNEHWASIMTLEIRGNEWKWVAMCAEQWHWYQSYWLYVWWAHCSIGCELTLCDQPTSELTTLLFRSSSLWSHCISVHSHFWWIAHIAAGNDCHEPWAHHL